MGKRETASEIRRSKKQQSHDDYQSNPCNISFNTAGREKALQLFRRRLLPNLSLCRASATLISSSLISLPATQAVSQSRRSTFQTGISIQVCKQTSAMRDGYKNRHKAKGTFIRFFLLPVFLMRASSLLGERVNHGCRVGQVAGWHQRLALYDAGRQRRDSLRAPPPPQSTGFHLHPLILYAWAKTRGGADSRSSCGERERAKGAPRICE